jgi:hypothetical protein
MYKGLCQLHRVYCLSEVCDSPLMWAHYTGSHTGICLEFDALAAPFTRQTGAAKVIYRKTYPSIDITGTGYEGQGLDLLETRGWVDVASGVVET